MLPAAIIFINSVVDEIVSILSSQLFISESISGAEFDLRLNNDPNYAQIVHNFGMRILVIREDYPAEVNREFCDVIATVGNNGMISILKNNIPALTLPIDKINIYELLAYNKN